MEKHQLNKPLRFNKDRQKEIAEQGQVESIIYHSPEKKIETLELNGKVEEVRGYLNGRLVFLIVNGKLLNGSIQDVDMVLSKEIITREEYKKRFLFNVKTI